MNQNSTEKKNIHVATPNEIANILEIVEDQYGETLEKLAKGAGESESETE